MAIFQLKPGLAVCRLDFKCLSEIFCRLPLTQPTVSMHWRNNWRKFLQERCYWRARFDWLLVD